MDCSMPVTALACTQRRRKFSSGLHDAQADRGQADRQQQAALARG